MNVSDTELVRSILTDAGFTIVEDEGKARVVLLNTCAIRDGAEQKVSSLTDETKQHSQTHMIEFFFLL